LFSGSENCPVFRSLVETFLPDDTESMVLRFGLVLLVLALPPPTFLHAQTAEGWAGVFPDTQGGRITASGEPYDPAALTAGAPNLRLGMRLAVTNPANGQVTTVRVNDGGPSAAGRVVTLSRAAAAALDLPSGGPVQIRALRVDEPEVSTPVRTFVPTPPAVSFLQMGAFRTPANARKLAQALAGLGYQPRLRKEGWLFRVYLTVAESDASALVDKLTAQGRRGFFQLSKEPGGAALPLSTE